MNFCSVFLRNFSAPKHSSDKSYHLNYPLKRICSSIFNFSKIENKNQMQFLNFVFFLIIKSSFSIYIKIISKQKYLFGLFFSTNSCRGLSKIFWIEKDIVSWSHFFDSFTQKQCIRCKQKKYVTFSPRKIILKK